jgi:hypothetical protein
VVNEQLDNPVAPVPQLALILRSQGRLPAAPPAAPVTWVQPGERGFYRLQPEGSTALAGQLGRRRSTRYKGCAATLAKSGSSNGGSVTSATDGVSDQQCLHPEAAVPHVADNPALAAQINTCAAQEAGTVTNVWVQCGKCHKWRRLPPATQASCLTVVVPLLAKSCWHNTWFCSPTCLV